MHACVELTGRVECVKTCVLTPRMHFRHEKVDASTHPVQQQQLKALQICM